MKDKADSPLIPYPSSLIPLSLIPYPLIPHPSSLIPHPSSLIPRSPRQFHLPNDLLRQLLNSFLLPGHQRLSAFRHEVSLLPDVHQKRRGRQVVLRHDQIAAAVDPIGLNEECGLDIPRLAELVVGQDALAVRNQPHAEHAVGRGL